jgi:hypothetical protein
VGKLADLVQFTGMSDNPPPDKHSLLMAEEVLRTIYGDDLKGCSVSLDQIATVLRDMQQRQQAQTQGLLELYEKVVEAVHLLSTPPDPSNIADPNALRSLLSERLDAIHVVATKTIQTTTLARNEPE